MTGTQDCYGENSTLYADERVRPVYPDELFERIFTFAGSRSGTALDVGTGTGQCAQVLAKTFQQVYATDSSEEQLRQCKANPRIEFRQANSEKSGLEAGSVDLVTVATALHWFDIPAFYREARRVLKPTGVLAAWAYKLPAIESNRDADHIFQKFYNQTLLANAGATHRIWLDEYRGHEPSEQEFNSIKRETLGFKMESTIENLIAFLRTNGLYTQFRQCFPDKPDPLPGLQQEFLAAMDASDVKQGLTLHFPVYLILAKGPKALHRRSLG